MFWQFRTEAESNAQLTVIKYRSFKRRQDVSHYLTLCTMGISIARLDYAAELKDLVVSLKTENYICEHNDLVFGCTTCNLRAKKMIA